MTRDEIEAAIDQRVADLLAGAQLAPAVLRDLLAAVQPGEVEQSLAGAGALVDRLPSLRSGSPLSTRLVWSKMTTLAAPVASLIRRSTSG